MLGKPAAEPTAHTRPTVALGKPAVGPTAHSQPTVGARQGDHHGKETTMATW